MILERGREKGREGKRERKRNIDVREKHRSVASYMVLRGIEPTA